MGENSGEPVTFGKKELKKLKKEIEGKALVPGNWGYDRASEVWDSTGFKQHPALTVVPKKAADIQVAVSFAREHNLPIAVQSGGHGHPHPANEAMFINFEKMTAIEVDKEKALARLEPGVLLKDLVKEAYKHDLAPLSGFSQSVGVTGYMLAGGISWLTRKYGAGASSIRAVELVTADGFFRRVTETEDPDLFWGLRGAGANYGVVTALECALYPHKEVFGGHVVYPVKDVKEVLDAYVDFTRTAPPELTSAVRITPFPFGEILPEPEAGKTAVIIMACYCGDPGEGERLLLPLRTIVKPLRDSFKKMPFSKVGKISDDPPVAPPFHLYSDGGALTSLTSADLENIEKVAGNPDSGIAVTEIRHLGGALAAQPEGEMAFSFREPNFYIYMQAAAPHPENLAKSRASMDHLLESLKPSMPGRLLLNFIDGFGKVGLDRTKAAYYPVTFERLRDLKSRYDPANVFRFNHNIPPR
ncbi:MAG: FAD-binding oxidoreductase [Chloroflexi bacterium]|nr:FAD-binding oxidoreductase [Chloroflexota bacterium]OJV97552.1 MAG: hypothetical protein BGO39_07240 [Chloroflexi bacterium 54-19]